MSDQEQFGTADVWMHPTDFERAMAWRRLCLAPTVRDGRSSTTVRAYCGIDAPHSTVRFVIE